MDPFAILLFGLAIVAGAVAAVAGFGIGSLLTPALALTLGTSTAVAVVAFPHLVATAIRLWMLRNRVDRHVLQTFGLASAVGGLVGALLHAMASSPALTILLGALLVISGMLELTGLGRRWRMPGGLAILAGLASGAFGGLVGNQGGIRSAALLRFELAPQPLVATATATAMLVDLGRVPVYLITNRAEISANLPTVLLLAIGVVAGTLVGAPLLRRLPDQLFRQAVGMILVVLGAGLILGAA